MSKFWARMVRKDRERAMGLHLEALQAWDTAFDACYRYEHALENGGEVNGPEYREWRAAADRAVSLTDRFARSTLHELG